jgi:hypothetical protein
LQKKVQKRKAEVKKASITQSTPLRGPGGKFISKKKSKKFLENKLRSKVQKKKGVDSKADSSNNEGDSEDDDFWDKLK